MALLAGGVRDGDLVKVDVAADGSGLVLTSAGAAPGTAGTDSGVGSASGSGGSDTEDVIEAELLDD